MDRRSGEPRHLAAVPLETLDRPDAKERNGDRKQEESRQGERRRHPGPGVPQRAPRGDDETRDAQHQHGAETECEEVEREIARYRRRHGEARRVAQASAAEKAPGEEHHPGDAAEGRERDETELYGRERPETRGSRAYEGRAGAGAQLQGEAGDREDGQAEHQDAERVEDARRREPGRAQRNREETVPEEGLGKGEDVAGGGEGVGLVEGGRVARQRVANPGDDPRLRLGVVWVAQDGVEPGRKGPGEGDRGEETREQQGEPTHRTILRGRRTRLMKRRDPARTAPTGTACGGSGCSRGRRRWRGRWGRRSRRARARPSSACRRSRRAPGRSRS